MFSDMLHLTTIKPTRITSTIYRHVTGIIIPSVNNQVHHFERPPRAMQMFTINAGIHHQILAATRDMHGPHLLRERTATTCSATSATANTTSSFVIDRTRDNMIRAGIILGRLIVRIKAVSYEGALPKTAPTAGP
jgi:hypothetical protein